MNDQTVIEVRELSKMYKIYERPAEIVRELFSGRKHHRELWALKNVSFEVKKGEAFGIIGRNGAGKSTLLRILTGVLDKTSGSVQVNGRISAILELGTGFHPEYTGRDNILMGGLCLGLSREEIQEQMESIIEFSELEAFMDQPVKTYSTGMVMRLAFAVQTAVNPQILIVDEALAVGDMFFQAKCVARIHQLMERGVSLLLVSHDIQTVRQLCQKAILLRGGTVAQMGEVRAVTDRYFTEVLKDINKRSLRLKKEEDQDRKGVSGRLVAADPIRDEGVRRKKTEDWLAGKDKFDRWAQWNRSGNGDAQILNVQLLREGRLSHGVDYNEKVTLRVVVHFSRELTNINAAIKIRTPEGVDIAFCDTRLAEKMGQVYEAHKTYLFDWHLTLPLMHGRYAIFVGLSHPPSKAGEDWVFVDVLPHAYEFSVSPRREGMLGGYLALPAEVEITPVGEVLQPIE